MFKKLYIFILLLFMTSGAFANIKHEVKEKETIFSISRTYGVTVEEIVKTNNIDNPNKIFTGQILIIPVKDLLLKHEVRDGDSLSTISIKYNVSLQELMKVNSLRDSEIKTGQILIIPEKNPDKGKVHKVKKGETLSEIASFYKVSTSSICKANSIEDDDIIMTGTLLIIPPCEENDYVINPVDEYGIISEMVINLNVKPDPNSDFACQAVLWDKIYIQEKSDNWCFITTSDGFSGWMEKQYILPLGQENFTSTVIVSDLMIDILDMPDKKGNILQKAVMGTKLPLIEKQEQWLKVLLPDSKTGWIIENQILYQEKSPQTGREIVETAKMYLGVPYVWAGTTGAGVDCSGFVYTVYKMNGYKIPRDAESQFHYCETKKDEELEPGDLVFFTTYLPGPSHVGIYLGDRNFIHASSSKGVTITSLDKEYYKKRYLGGGRIKEMVPSSRGPAL